jgi:SAM-dependent methyltransferase
MGWDPAAYGSAFAEVYDDWYGDGPALDAVVETIGNLHPDRAAGRLLELGVGTGRLAIPLAQAGWAVMGLDASAAMLDRLVAKRSGIEPVLGDAAVRSDYPDGPFDVVLAAYNFLFNLPDRATQLDCLSAAGQVASARGLLVVEAFIPEAVPPSGEITSPGPVEGVVIVSEVDATSGVVHGEHRHSDGRRRPWHVCPATPNELDDMASRAGWTLEHRWEDWDGAPFEPEDSPAHVSVYRRSPLL